MSKESTSLTTTSSTALDTQQDDPDNFEHVAEELHEAIARDKQAIEAHLAMLQVELERGMEHVAETRDRAIELKGEAEKRIDVIKHKAARLKDWKGLVHDYPWQTVGISLAIGFYLGGLRKDA